MDLQMPIMDGYQATEVIRATNKTLPIIALTAHTMDTELGKCLEYGMNGHLSKPIEVDTLYKTIGKILG
jgi:CheY-like chemotaxis protein